MITEQFYIGNIWGLIKGLNLSFQYNRKVAILYSNSIMNIWFLSYTTKEVKLFYRFSSRKLSNYTLVIEIIIMFEGVVGFCSKIIGWSDEAITKTTLYWIISCRYLFIKISYIIFTTKWIYLEMYFYGIKLKCVKKLIDFWYRVIFSWHL